MGAIIDYIRSLISLFTLREWVMIFIFIFFFGFVAASVIGSLREDKEEKGENNVNAGKDITIPIEPQYQDQVDRQEPFPKSELKPRKKGNKMKKSTKFFDVICFVLGPSIATGSYVYGDSSGVAIGVALICLGFLRVYWRKNTPPYKDQEEK